MSESPVVRLIVSLDVEEDNWVAMSSGITTRNIALLPALDRRFETLGVRPTYFTNYQVAVQANAAAVMRDLHATGRSEIGAHLHPWNTPPLAERMETMLLNLPREMQRRKIATVTEEITNSIGVVPRSFRAGRFGLGPSTVQALIESGYSIDSSVTPFYSWEEYDHGPSFVGAPLRIYGMSGTRDVREPDAGPLVEVPVTSGYRRWAMKDWSPLHTFLNGPAAKYGLRGLAARLYLARRVILSPEPHDVGDLYGLAKASVDGGVPFLHIFWHSSSMMPGLTPFCRTQSDVERLQSRFERLLDHLSAHVSIRPVTIGECVTELADGNAQRGDVSPAARDAIVVEPAPLLPSDMASVEEIAGPLLAPPERVPPPPDVRQEPTAGGLGRHTAIYLAGMLLTRAAGFVMLPFYTHYLTPADYGIMQLMEMTLDVISIVAGTRIASGIHRYYFKATTDAERNAVLSTAIVLLTVSFLAFGALSFIFADPLTRIVLGSTEHAHLMRIASMTFALQSLVIVPLGIIQLWKRSVLYTLLTSGRIIFQLLLNVLLLAVFGLGITGVFISTLAANIVLGTVLAVLIIRPIGIHFWRPAAVSLLRYGIPLVGTQMATFFVTYGDRYFLRVSADVAEVGLYSLAYQFGFIVASVGYYPFAMVWEPSRFQLANRPDRDALYSRAFVFMNVIQLVATVGCALFVRDFIIVMSDDAYHSAYLVVPVILAAYLLQSWAYFHEVGILVKERTSLVTVANWIAAGVCLIGYIVLIPRWLAWGAAVTTLLAFLVRWIITYVTAQRLLPVRYEWTPVLRLVALAIVIIAIGLVLPHPSVLVSLAMRTVLMTAFLVALWHSGAIMPNDKKRILEMARSPSGALRSLRG